MPLEPFPFSVQQRLRLIEALVLWEGTVKRQRICDVFGVARNHVTKDIKAYRDRYPGRLRYEPSLRSYVPEPGFEPVFASTSAREYLALITANAESGSTTLAPILGGDGVPTAVIPGAAGALDSGLLQLIVKAISDRTAIDVQYHSMSAEASRRRRLWPHAMINAGNRWDIRAYDDVRREFRNFALQRIDDPRPIAIEAPVDPSEDEDWHTVEILQVIPDPRLNRHQRQIVAREFGMRRRQTEWIWQVEVRRCLVSYFVARHRLDGAPDENPQRQRIVLRNPPAVAPFVTQADDSG